MYFYDIGYTTWEECPHITIWHENKFTQDEFNEILLDCYIAADKIKSAKHSEWFEEYREKELAEGESEEMIDHMRYKPRVSDMYDTVLDLLLSKYGFRNIDITATFMPCDNYNIIPEPDKKSGHRDALPEHDVETKLLRERFTVVEPRNNKIDTIIDPDGQ